MSDIRRMVTHFSCGTSSAVASKLALSEWRGKVETVVLRCVIPSEHPDNERFAKDIEAWLDHQITEVRSEKYVDIWDVWERNRFISGPKGAKCTTELKKIPGQAFWELGDLDVFGYNADARDRRRWENFRAVNFELTVDAPLIRADLGKSDCHALIERAGIDLPAMYRLGFNNNNCIGCGKARGAGYWNLVRRHFPERFERMAKLCRDLNFPIIQAGGGYVFLDELSPDAGRHDEELDIECGLFCYAAEQDMA